MSVDTINDLAFFGFGVWGDGELWTCRGVNDFGGRCTGRSNSGGFRMGREGGWIHECDGGGAEFCLGGDDFDGVAEDVGGSGHVVVLWWCCWR